MTKFKKRLLSWPHVVTTFLAISGSAAFSSNNQLITKRCATEIFSSSTEVELLDQIREGVEEAGHGEEWQASAKLLSDNTGMDCEDSELVLSKALEWRAWAMAPSPIMRKYIKPKTPNAKTLGESIEFLTSQDGLKMSEEMLLKAVTEHPKAYLVDADAQFSTVMACAPKDYNSEEKLGSLIQQDVSAMRNIYNCATAEEGCAGKCGTCWVTYSKK